MVCMESLIIQEITEIFKREDVKFDIFKKLVKTGSVVRAIITKNTKNKPRSFFDNIDKWAKEQGSSGLAYFTIEQDKEIKGKGPVGKFFSEDSLKELMKKCNLEIGDSIFLACGKDDFRSFAAGLSTNRSARTSLYQDPVVPGLP